MIGPVSTAGTGAERVPCAHCDRVFLDANSLWQHARAKHGTKAAQAVQPKRPARTREPSLGEELAEAIADARAGQPVEGYLLDMFRDQFPRGTKRLALASSASARPGVGEGEGGDGWRWFGRASRNTHRKPANEVRRQVQVYLENPMEGW